MDGISERQEIGSQLDRIAEAVEREDETLLGDAEPTGHSSEETYGVCAQRNSAAILESMGISIEGRSEVALAGDAQVRFETLLDANQVVKKGVTQDWGEESLPFLSESLPFEDDEANRISESRELPSEFGGWSTEETSNVEAVNSYGSALFSAEPSMRSETDFAAEDAVRAEDAAQDMREFPSSGNQQWALLTASGQVQRWSTPSPSQSEVSAHSGKSLAMSTENELALPEAPPSRRPSGADVAACAEEEEAAAAVVVKALAAHPVFSDCPTAFISGLVDKAERCRVAPGEFIQLDEKDCLYIVEHGALHVRVGSSSSQTVAMGPGSIFNSSNFIGLRKDVEQLMEVGFDEVTHGAYHAQERSPEGVLPEAMIDRRHPADTFPRQTVRRAKKDSDEPAEDSSRVVTRDELILYGVCPYGTVPRRLWDRPGCLPLKVVGAHPSDSATRARAQGGKALADSGGAVLAMIPAFLVHGSGVLPGKRPQPAVEDTIDLLAKRSEAYKSFWRGMITAVGSIILPGAPPEVLWALSEVATALAIDEGSEVVSEGEPSDDIVVLTGGIAAVECKAGWKDKAPQHQVSGRLLAGSIIGDVCLIGAKLPRMASVRALTQAHAIRLPADGLLSVLDRFPGALYMCDSRLRETAEFFQENLPPCPSIVPSLNLFRGCGQGFLDELAGLGQRRVLLCAQTVVQEGSAAGMLCVIEYGQCCVEVAAKGCPCYSMLSAGDCFGERALLGLSAVEATVRVASPMAVLFQVKQRMLRATLEKYPEEHAHYQELRNEPPCGLSRICNLQQVGIFQFCSQECLGLIGTLAQTQSYLPGQSIVVEGDEEDDMRMFVLIGGRVVAENSGKFVAMLPEKATFGDLAFLGATRKRTATIRAVTLVTALVLPKSALATALESFPHERANFQSLKRRSSVKGGDPGSSSQIGWPFLRDVNGQLAFMLDLHAARKTLRPGDSCLAEAPLCSGAILIVKGTASVFNDKGVEVELLKNGACFNEQTLVGVAPLAGLRLVPKTSCDVCVLLPGHVDKVMADLPDQRGNFKEAVLKCMALRAEKDIGHEPGGTGLLRSCIALLANSPEELVQELRRSASHMLVLPKERIAGVTDMEIPWEQDESLYILLSGTATSVEPYVNSQVLPGSGFGESMLMGVTKRYPGSMWADTVCHVLRLSREALQHAINLHGATEQAAWDTLRKEVGAMDHYRIRSILSKTSRFKGVGAEVCEALCPRAHLVLFPPNSTMCQVGDYCTPGETNFYLMLSGQAFAQSSLGTNLSTVSPGGCIGEMGAFGLVKHRSATIVTWNKGLVCCACFKGAAVTEGLRLNPKHKQEMSNVFKSQEEENIRTEKTQRKWITGVAKPMLAQTSLLSGCSDDFLQNLANHCVPTMHEAGAVMCVGGEPATTMHVLVEGSAELMTHSGQRVGKLNAGAAFGEMSCLGVFPHNMATMRAVTPCQVIEVTKHMVDKSLESSDDDKLMDGLHHLVESRRDQALSGVPLTLIMGPHLSVEEAAVRTVAMMSEFVTLRLNEVLPPVGNREPAGEYIGFLTKGRAKVQMDGQEGDNLMLLFAGDVIPEGILAEFGAHVKGDLPCEIYRIPKHVFETALASDPASNKWMPRFRMKEKEVLEKLRSRLTNKRGMWMSMVPHKKDREIHNWSSRMAERKMNKSSSDIQLSEASSDSSPAKRKSGPPPGFMPLHFNHATCELSERKHKAREVPIALRESGAGLRCYSVVKLPKIKRPLGLDRSCSEPRLPGGSPSRLIL